MPTLLQQLCTWVALLSSLLASPKLQAAGHDSQKPGRTSFLSVQPHLDSRAQQWHTFDGQGDKVGAHEHLARCAMSRLLLLRTAWPYARLHSTYCCSCERFARRKGHPCHSGRRQLLTDTHRACEPHKCLRTHPALRMTAAAQTCQASPARPCSWMAHHAHLLRNATLVATTLPGTHDSASYNLTGAVMPGALPWPEQRAVQLIELLGVPVTRCIVRWSQAQTLDVGAQLRRGARYLDLRAGAGRVVDSA